MVSEKLCLYNDPCRPFGRLRGVGLFLNLHRPLFSALHLTFRIRSDARKARTAPLVRRTPLHGDHSPRSKKEFCDFGTAGPSPYAEGPVQSNLTFIPFLRNRILPSPIEHPPSPRASNPNGCSEVPVPHTT